MSVREAKEAQVAEIREAFDRATAAVLLDFRGVDVESITALRSEFRKAGVDYKVVKNTLVKLAIKDSNRDIEDFKSHLKGPTGIAWSYEDPSVAAKIVKKFRKENGEAGEKLTVKCGLLDAEVMPGDKVESVLATMPGKDELRATLLATLQAPAQNLVALLQAPAQNFVYLLDAKRREEEGS